jgi:predicted Zn-dependent protease
LSASGKYFDGRTAVSRPVELSVEGDVLRIEHNGNALARWPIASLFRDDTHSVAAVIGCGTGDERVEVLDPEFLKYLKLETKVWNRYYLQRYKWYIVAYGAVILGLGIMTVLNTRLITRYFANKVSPEQERSLAQKLIASSKVEFCALTPSQQKSFDKIITRLYARDPKARSHAEIGFVENPVENAFTFPGGYIFVYSGLLKQMESPEELAGVLAHEIEHVEKRHVMEALAKATLFTVMLNLTAGDASSIMLVDPSTAAQIVGLKLSREMETEADDGALLRLNHAHISPKGMTDFFERLEKKDHLGKTLAFLSTHPASEERVNRFKLRENVESDPELLSAEEWNDLKAACEPKVEKAVPSRPRRFKKRPAPRGE